MKRVDPLAGVSTFLTLADLRSFAATAKRLGISAATVSTQIADLEKRLAVRLVHRSTRHVTLTTAGEAYRDAMRGVLEQADRANTAATAFKEDLSGTIRIAAPLGFAERFFKKTIDLFIERYPEISFDLYLSAETVSLIEGGYDLAIRGTHATEPNWITRKIREVRVYVAASPAYLKKHGTPAAPEDLIKHDCIHYSSLSFGKTWPLRKGSDVHRVAIKPRLQSNEAQALRQWALEGHGIVLLPDTAIGPDIAGGSLIEVLPEWRPASFDINAVYPDNKHISAKVKLFVDSLIENNTI